MFMVSFRLSRKRVAIFAVVLIALIGLGVGGSRLIGGGEAMASATTGETGTKIKASKATAKTDEERIAFISSFGWEVESTPLEVVEVIIPEEFDEVYEAYNAVQKKQGFNLEKYAGKRVKRYTYKVVNYPGTESEVRLNLLMQGDRIIGGDVASLAQDGFLHGFAPAG